MLELIRIRNLAIIDQVEIPFKSGLNILSGETGAGKSIVLEAIALILGGRSSQDYIRHGADEASVEGVFQISDRPRVQERLRKLGVFEGLDPSGKIDELLIRRVIHRSGKGRVYANGELITLANLQLLCEDLVDLCSQHEHQSLLKPAVQAEWLDRFGSNEKEASSLAQDLEAYRQRKRRLRALLEGEPERMRKLDFLRFQAQDLDALDPQEGEDELLSAEKKLLQSVHQRLSLGGEAQSLISGDGSHGALHDVRLALARAEALEALDPSLAPFRETLERARAECEEASLLIERYLSTQELDPERLETVQSRLSKLAELKRKYGPDLASAIAQRERFQSEIEALERAEPEIGELKASIAGLEADLKSRGRALHEKRVKTAKRFSDRVTKELRELRMNEAAFGVGLEPIEEIDDWSSFSGPSAIEYRIQTNAGDVPRALGKVASGGELSRVMLSIRQVLSSHATIGVYLFDEIDAGMGGQTAFVVGSKLKKVAAENQVICITHLAQVAAYADHHLVVEKSTRGKRAQTEIRAVESKGHVEEIARMLGGSALTQTSLRNAKELVKSAHPE